MKKHYFEIDKVTSVTLTMETETSNQWYDEIKPRPKKFLGIIIGYKPAIPAGWNDSESEDEGHYRYRRTTSYFEQYKSYRIDLIAMKIFNKAQVTVRLGYKEGFTNSFESSEKAQAWVDELIASTDKTFHVIINQ